MLMTTTFILVGWISDYLNSKAVATLITFNTGRRRFHLWMWIVIFQSTVLIWRYVKWSECLLVRDESHCCNITWLWLFIFVQIVSHPFQIYVSLFFVLLPQDVNCVFYSTWFYLHSNFLCSSMKWARNTKKISPIQNEAANDET